MSATNLSRFEELVSRYLDERLTDTDASELVALLADPVLATRFLEMTRLNSEITGLLSAPVPDAAMAELVRSDIEKSLTAAQPSTGVGLRIAERTPACAEMGPSVLSAPRPLARRRKPEWRALAWAAVFLVFAGLAALLFLNRTRLAEAPTVASLEGEVRLIGPAGERVPTPGDSWQENEGLKTVGPDGSVTLKLRDGSQLDFSTSARAVKEPSIHGCRIRLEYGVLQATVKKHSVSAPFIFVTPEAEVRVVGTKLRLVASLHSTRLEVSEGEVRFHRRHDGKEIMLKSGEYAVVAPNTPFIPKAIHPEPHHGK